jgi:flagellar protein FliJ
MAKFKFALQPILEQRERVERDRQIEVAAIQAERLALEQQLREAHATSRGEREAWRSALAPANVAGSVDLWMARQQAFAVVSADGRARMIENELPALRKRLEAARTRLAQAAKERRAMELLRDRRYEEWLAAINKKERDFLDELGVQASVRASEHGDVEDLGARR